MSNAFDERSRSLWMDVEVAPARPLDGDHHCDTVVIGSGIAGLSTAYELAAAGQRVIVLDRGRIAGGMTARTSAHLAPLCDDLMSELIKLRGEEMARGFYESQAAAVDRIELLQGILGIDCAFRRLDGFLFQAPDTEAKMIDDELDAVRKVGAPVHRTVGTPLKGTQGQHALRYPDQATFHPLRYLRGLAHEIARLKGMVFSDTRVDRVDDGAHGVQVFTDRGVVSAAHAVVATNSPIVDMFALHTKMAPYRTYALAVAVERHTVPDALYWDTLDPYHYVRFETGAGGSDRLIVGGADHKTGEADDADARFSGLEAWIRDLVAGLGEVTHRWSGQVLDTIDYAGFIGRNPGSRHVFVVTGDSGQGLTHGVASSLINSSLILNGNAKWSEVYEPSRKTVRGGLNYVKENLTAVRNFAEYLAPGEIGSAADLKPGQGGIIRRGLSKVAAFRDEDGTLIEKSAACTHIGCHLHWNSFERCWDCPCHGSHFAGDGTALNAPAVAPLADAGSHETSAEAPREEVH